MAIRKINSGYQAVDSDDWQELAKKFPKGFQYFFIPCETPKNTEEEKLVYITSEYMETKIRKSFSNNESTFSILIGERRIGKSILLRNFFNISGNMIKIEKKTLILSNMFHGNCQNKGEHFSIEKIIIAMNVKLLEKYPKLLYYFNSMNGKKDFFDFIKKMRIDILQTEKLLETSLEVGYLQCLNESKRYNPEVYEMLKLQFLLVSALCPIERLIICVDDMDELLEWQQKEIICSFMALYKRLNSFPLDKMDKYYIVNMLISMSPNCYRILNKEKKLGKYSDNHVILKDDLINLEKYFSKKLKYYSRKQERRNIDTWKKCQRQFGHICQKFKGKYDRMIKNLTFYNIEESMLLYAKILCNRRWVKQGNIPSSDSWFNSENFTLNNISVIRAIACGENEQFVNSPNSYISNLLYNKRGKDNTIEKDYSIICFYVIMLFMRHSNANHLYGSSYLLLRNIECVFKDIFSTIPEIETDVRETIQYLYSHRILRKSFKDTTISKINDDMDLLTEDSRLYLSPKGVELWNMLQSDSVFIEMCREDYYREYDSSECNNNPYSTYHLMQTNQQHELFIDLCRIEHRLIDLEEEYISSAEKNQTKSLLIETFGNKMMCSYLMQGIKSSMEYSGLIHMKTVNKECQEVEQRLFKL